MQTGVDYIDRAALHEQASDFVAAETAWRKALLEMDRKDEAYFSVMEHLAYCLHKRGRNDAAIDVLIDCINDIAGTLGANSPRRAAAINRLAGFFYYRKDLRKALAYCKEAMSIYESTVGCADSAWTDVYRNFKMIQREIETSVLRSAMQGFLAPLDSQPTRASVLTSNASAFVASSKKAQATPAVAAFMAALPPAPETADEAVFSAAPASTPVTPAMAALVASLAAMPDTAPVSTYRHPVTFSAQVEPEKKTGEWKLFCDMSKLNQICAA